MKRLLRPFDYVAGWNAMLWGVVLLVFTIIFSWKTGVVARGNFSIGYAASELTFMAVTIRMVVIWLVLATLLYLAGLLFSKSKIRAVDVYGTNLLASAPITVCMVLSAITVLRDLPDKLREYMGDPQQLAAMVSTPLVITIALVLLLLLILYFYWSYSAFSVSVNMRGWKAVVIYAVCQIAAQILLVPISQGFAAAGLA